MSMFKIAACAAVVVASLAMETSAFAGSKSHSLGASTYSPGHEMQDSDGPAVGNHGASSFSPGREMQDSNTSGTPPGHAAEPGASGFAPGDHVSKGKK
ncbi:MAG TPA: hypothetical protein VHC71_11360 [Hyphomicrobium sp.]|nr:hypothetical protein [Hyphomicrobium sp.]